MAITFNPGEPINNGLQTANNGLKVNPAGNAQLGGEITELTIVVIDNGSHPLVFQGLDSIATPTKQAVIFAQGGAVPTVQMTASDPTFVNPDMQNTVLVNNNAVSIQGGARAGKTIKLDLSAAAGAVLQDLFTVPTGLRYGGNYDATLTDDSLVPKRFLGVYLTPLLVDDSLGIFTNADCNAAMPTAGIGQELQGVTVMYKNINFNTWVNYPYTACL